MIKLQFKEISCYIKGKILVIVREVDDFMRVYHGRTLLFSSDCIDLLEDILNGDIILIQAGERIRPVAIKTNCYPGIIVVDQVSYILCLDGETYRYINDTQVLLSVPDLTQLKQKLCEVGIIV